MRRALARQVRAIIQPPATVELEQESFHDSRTHRREEMQLSPASPRCKEAPSPVFAPRSLDPVDAEERAAAGHRAQEWCLASQGARNMERDMVRV